MLLWTRFSLNRLEALKVISMKYHSSENKGKHALLMQVEKMYQKSWGSSLPPSWLEEMEKGEEMIVDRAAGPHPMCRTSEQGLGVAGVVVEQEMETVVTLEVGGQMPDWGLVAGRLKELLDCQCAAGRHRWLPCQLETVYRLVHGEELPEGWQAGLVELLQVEEGGQVCSLVPGRGDRNNNI